jgi:hypothetical protein
LKADGKGIKTIMRELELAKETLQRFYRAESVEELLAKPRAGRPSVLDAYKPYLHERWNAGVTTASTLHREITEQGYQGSPGHRRRLPGTLPSTRRRTTATPATPKLRQITSWMLRRPEDLNTEEQLHLKQVLAACPHLKDTATHVAAFAEMLTGRHGERLDSWRPHSTLTTCPTCTASSPDCGATTRQSATASRCPTAQEPWKAMSTASK